MQEKKVTETTTKTKHDLLGNPKEQTTITKETEVRQNDSGSREEKTVTTERKEKR